MTDSTTIQVVHYDYTGTSKSVPFSSNGTRITAPDSYYYTSQVEALIYVPVH